MTPTEAEDEDAPLSAADFAALDRAIRTYSDRTQIERKLATETWREAAEFAAYGCQMDSLHLRPWQPPPCHIDNLVAAIQAGDDGILGDYRAAKLLQRLLDAGLSRFEPDPIAALKAKKRPPRPSR